jgi:hypothetical protein
VAIICRPVGAFRNTDDFRNLMRGDTARGCELGQDAGASLDADAFEFVSQSVINNEVAQR